MADPEPTFAFSGQSARDNARQHVGHHYDNASNTYIAQQVVNVYCVDPISWTFHEPSDAYNAANFNGDERPSTPDKSLLILLFSGTGAGKSTFIRCATEQDAPAGRILTSREDTPSICKAIIHKLTMSCRYSRFRRTSNPWHKYQTYRHTQL